MFAILQDEPRGKNITQGFLFTAKIMITKYILFVRTFSLYLRSENVKTFKLKICKLISNLMQLYSQGT